MDQDKPVASTNAANDTVTLTDNATGESYTFPVYIGDAAVAGAGRGEPRIVGEHAGFAIEPADVDDPRPDLAFVSWQLPCLTAAVLRQGKSTCRLQIGRHCLNHGRCLLALRFLSAISWVWQPSVNSPPAPRRSNE